MTKTLKPLVYLFNGASTKPRWVYKYLSILNIYCLRVTYIREVKIIASIARSSELVLHVLRVVRSDRVVSNTEKRADREVGRGRDAI